MKTEKYSVPAIDNSVKILEYLMKESPEGKTLSEISEAADLNPSTCFRILHSLQKYNVVSYYEVDKTYKLGVYLTLLGNKAANSIFDLKKMEQFLEKAALLTNQTCILSQRFSDDKVMYIAKQEGLNDFTINVSVGQQRSITSTSSGKCFMAYMEQEEVESIIDLMGGLKKYTEHTILDKQQFLNELKQTKERGYSLGNQEFFLGVTGLAVPVFGPNQAVSFVLSMSCFSAQVNDQKLHEYATILKEIAHQISTTFIPETR